MDQPLFSCTKCFRNFPQSEMSRSGQTCKACNPHHAIFKQCEYCKSDFKNYVYGTLCPRCQSLKSKYGDPQQCTICCLKMAFGNALVCQRCLHYRNRFGEPRSCQSCGQKCAFLKDEASRQKVDGQVLCWLCTYNFKLARSREHSERSTSSRGHDYNSTGSERRKMESCEKLKRHRSDDYRHASPNRQPNQGARKVADSSDHQKSSQTTHSNLDSVYNENLLTIGTLEDEVKSLKRLLSQKDLELLNKDRSIAELRSEIIELKGVFEDRLLKAKAAAQVEQDRLSVTIRQLQREKVTLNQGLKRRRSSGNVASLAGAARARLRNSVSSVSLLFNPDSPIQTASTASSGKALPTSRSGAKVGPGRDSPSVIASLPRESPSVTVAAPIADRLASAGVRTDQLVVSEPRSDDPPGKRSKKADEEGGAGQPSVKAGWSTDSKQSSGTPSSPEEEASSLSPNLATPSPGGENSAPTGQPTSPTSTSDVSSLASVGADSGPLAGRKDARRFDEDPLGFVTDSDNDDDDDGDS